MPVIVRGEGATGPRDAATSTACPGCSSSGGSRPSSWPRRRRGRRSTPAVFPRELRRPVAHAGRRRASAPATDRSLASAASPSDAWSPPQHWPSWRATRSSPGRWRPRPQGALAITSAGHDDAFEPLVPGAITVPQTVPGPSTATTSRRSGAGPPTDRDRPQAEGDSAARSWSRSNSTPLALPPGLARPQIATGCVRGAREAFCALRRSADLAALASARPTCATGCWRATSQTPEPQIAGSRPLGARGRAHGRPRLPARWKVAARVREVVSTPRTSSSGARRRSLSR